VVVQSIGIQSIQFLIVRSESYLLGQSVGSSTKQIFKMMMGTKRHAWIRTGLVTFFLNPMHYL